MSNLPTNLPQALFGFSKRITDPDYFRKTEQEEPHRVLLRLLEEKKLITQEDIAKFDQTLTARAITPLTERINRRFDEIYRHLGTLSVTAGPGVSAAAGGN